MEKRVYRPSEILTYEDCPRKYFFQYVKGIRTQVTSANLVYGTAFHAAVEAYIKDGNKDSEAVYQSVWDKQVSEFEVEFSSTWEPEEMLASGLMLARRFGEFWEESGLMALRDIHGPIVERRFQAEIAPGISLSTRLDLVAITPQADIIILDWKTPSTVTDSSEWYSDQLTCQQVVFEANAERVGVDQVDGLAFGNAVKRKVPKTGKGKGPTIEPLHILPARSEEDKREYIQKVIWIDEDIRRGRFPRRGRMAHNTPCTQCEYRKLCFDGDFEGLVAPCEKQVTNIF